MKCSKGKIPSVSKGSAPSTNAHKSRASSESNSNKAKVRNNAGGHIDARKSVASKVA